MDKTSKISLFLAFLAIASIFIYKYLIKGTALEYAISGYRLSNEALKYKEQIFEPYSDAAAVDFNWDEIGQWAKNNGFNTEADMGFIIAWFKGANIAATGWNVQLFTFEINNYLNSGQAREHGKVQMGEYV